MAGESGCNEGVRSCGGVDGAEVRSWMTCVSCVRVGVATDFTSVSYGVLPFLVFFHLVVVGRILPPAGLRPRLGLEPGGRGALTTLVTMALRTHRISSESVGSPGGTEGFVNSVVWASIGTGQAGILVALTTSVIMDLRTLEIISESVGGPVSAVDWGDSRACIRVGDVGAGVGANT